MTSRAFQDELDAAEAEQAAARKPTGTRRDRPPSTGAHSFDAYLGNSPEVDIIAHMGATVTRASFLYLDNNGNRVYRITLRSPWLSTSYHEWAVRGNQFVLPGGARDVPAPGMGGGRTLDDAKQQWKDWVTVAQDTERIMATTAMGFLSTINSFTGTPEQLDAMFRMIEINTFWSPGDFDPELGPGDPPHPGLGGGGGGGGGFTGPEYVAPDRRVIEDYVKGVLVSLVGTVSNDLETLVDLYMDEDRKNFDTPNQQIDPGQSVLEAVRKTSGYQSIHKLRPDSEDERTWISDRRAAALRGGLNTGDLEQHAIRSAQLGANLGDVPFGAAVTQFGVSGQAPPLLDTKFRRVAASMFGRVIR